MELGLDEDLAPLPEHLRKGGIAAGARALAREIDDLVVAGRDSSGHVREYRQCIAQLREWAPGAAANDTTDEVRNRRERRLGLASGG